MQYNTPLAILFLTPFVFLNGEFEIFKSNHSISFWLSQTFAGVLGFILNIAIYLNIKYTTPLTHNLSGTFKATVQTVLAYILFPSHETMSQAKIAGIILIIFFSTYYTFVRALEMKNKTFSSISIHKLISKTEFLLSSRFILIVSNMFIFYLYAFSPYYNDREMISIVLTKNKNIIQEKQHQINNSNNNLDNISYDLLIPVLYKDAKKLLSRQDILQEHVTFDKIVIIAPQSVQSIATGNSIEFIDENDLISFQAVKQVFLDRGYHPMGHAGWYYQQFLKMSYARICKKEYYLIWDSDVVPIRKVNMFQGNHPYFDMASEHHHPYFVTLNRILPQLKFSNASYVSEHMIIKTEYMKNLLDEIERNDKIKGKTYWEKILYSIDIEELLKTGFSEFETYGTYVDNRYPNYYIHRKWSSCRSIKHYYGKLENIRDQDIHWLAQDFDVITFEKWGMNFNKDIYEVVINSYFQQLFSPKQLFANVDNIVQAIQSIHNLKITKFLFIFIIVFEIVFILIRFLCLYMKLRKINK